MTPGVRALRARAAVALALLACGNTVVAAQVRDLRFDVRELSASVVDTVSVAETPKDVRIELPADVLFDFDKAVIRNEARDSLATAAKILRAHAGAKVQFNGHADSIGTEAHNAPLSLRRAKAVKAWLADREGILITKATATGYGSRQPAVPNTKPDGSDDPDGRQRNRRVEIVISK